MNYYAFFFVGIAEATNIPLTVVDACRAFPKLKEQIPKTNTMARLIFAISFFIVRVFWWPYVSYTFWLLSIDLIRNGDATKIHNIFVVYIFLFNKRSRNKNICGRNVFYSIVSATERRTVYPLPAAN